MTEQTIEPYSLEPTTAQKAKKASIWLVAIISLIHFVLAFTVELGGDEAHYALYGLNPALSYFDHPPMVGWLQIIPMWLAPEDWSARMVPILLYILLNYLLYQVTIQLFVGKSEQNISQPTNEWLGFASLLLLNTSLILPLMGMAMLPDNPLMVASLALILVVIKLRQQAKLKYWLLLGLFVGLAALSKYTAITLVASLLLLVIVEKRWQWFKEPGLWLAIVVTVLMITPVLYWNYQNDWASFLYQINHGTGSINWEIESFARTQAAQFAAYTPLLFLLGWWMILRIANYRHANSRLLLLFILPIFVLFGWGSGYEESLPHWVSFGWLLTIPLIVNWLFQRQNKFWYKPVLVLHLLVAGGLTLTAHSILVKPWLTFGDHKNPIEGDYGWPQAAKTALALQKELAYAPKDLPLFVSNWSIASHLTWYARPQPVYITDPKQTQFEFWFGLPKTGMNGLLVVPHYEPVPPITEQTFHFERCDERKQEDIRVNDSIVVTYRYYYCFNYQAPIGDLPAHRF